jgi:hypothetical protein
MISKYSVLIKKEPGFERINEVMARTFENDGWKANRSGNNDFIVVTSNKTQHYFKDETSAGAYITKLIGKKYINRVSLARFHQ